MRRLNKRHLKVVRCMERGLSTPEEIAREVGTTPGVVCVYVSQIRSAFGYSVIMGTPSGGYRIGEWPGREIPRPYGTATKLGRQPESARGVVITEAGRALGLR